MPHLAHLDPAEPVALLRGPVIGEPPPRRGGLPAPGPRISARVVIEPVRPERIVPGKPPVRPIAAYTPAAPTVTVPLQRVDAVAPIAAGLDTPAPAGADTLDPAPLRSMSNTGWITQDPPAPPSPGLLERAPVLLGGAVVLGMLVVGAAIALL